MSKNHSLSTIDALRNEAREHLERGAVTSDYCADVKVVIHLLNQALATELVCVLRYRRHFFMARGIHARSVVAEFLVHSNEELGHVDMLAARIVQLGGEPDFAPDGLADRSHAQYFAGNNLVDMIREDLVAERVAIISYREMIRYLDADDPTTSTMLKVILAAEEQHADELAGMLAHLPHSE